MSKIALRGALTGNGTFTIESPATNTDRTLTLPDASGTVVTTDATQTLTNKSIDAAQINSGTIGTARLGTGTPGSGNFLRGDGAWEALPAAGKVLQVVSTTKTDSFSTTSTSFVDVTGLSATITPSSASSKILITGTLQGGQSAGNRPAHFKLVRGSTDIAIGDTSGIRTRATVAMYDTGADINGAPTAAFSFLDSPNSTSALTYKIQMKGGSFNTSIILYINIGGQSQDYNISGISTLTVMEIAA